MFEAWETRIQNNIEEAKESGVYERGMESIKADSIQVLEKTELWQDPITKHRTYVNKILQQNRISYLTTEEAIARCRAGGGKLVYHPQQETVGFSEATYSRIDSKTGVSVARVNLNYPDNFSQKIDEAKFEESNWQEIDAVEFARLWNLAVKELPKFDSQTYFIITGLLLPIWDRLSKGDFKVWRVIADDGETILGRVISNSQIQSVYREFDQQYTYSAAEIIEEVEAGNTVRIDDGMRVKLSKVMYEYRLEIVGWNKNNYRYLLNLGCFSESIDWKLRLFLPNSKEKAVAILQELV